MIFAGYASSRTSAPIRRGPTARMWEKGNARRKRPAPPMTALRPGNARTRRTRSGCPSLRPGKWCGTGCGRNLGHRPGKNAAPHADDGSGPAATLRTPRPAQGRRSLRRTAGPARGAGPVHAWNARNGRQSRAEIASPFFIPRLSLRPTALRSAGRRRGGTPEEGMPSVLIVEDHALFRSGLKQLIGS